MYFINQLYLIKFMFSYKRIFSTKFAQYVIWVSFENCLVRHCLHFSMADSKMKNEKFKLFTMNAIRYYVRAVL